MFLNSNERIHEFLRTKYLTGQVEHEFQSVNEPTGWATLTAVLAIRTFTMNWTVSFRIWKGSRCWNRNQVRRIALRKRDLRSKAIPLPPPERQSFCPGKIDPPGSSYEQPAVTDAMNLYSCCGMRSEDNIRRWNEFERQRIT